LITLVIKKITKKGDAKITNEVFAKELGFREFQKQNPNFDYHIIFNARLQQKQTELFNSINCDLKK
jgi:Na+-transporting NADH:ubiquinone oxidoreductase subunit NqrF